MTTVTIPDSVTSIGDGAFLGCSALTTVTIPDSVTSIGDGAFLGCSKLTTVTIPDSVTSIGDDAFQNSGLTTVYMSETARGNLSLSLGANQSFFGSDSLTINFLTTFINASEDKINIPISGTLDQDSYATLISKEYIKEVIIGFTDTKCSNI